MINLLVNLFGILIVIGLTTVAVYLMEGHRGKMEMISLLREKGIDAKYRDIH